MFSFSWTKVSVLGSPVFREASMEVFEWGLWIKYLQGLTKLSEKKWSLIEFGGTIWQDIWDKILESAPKVS